MSLAVSWAKSRSSERAEIKRREIKKFMRSEKVEDLRFFIFYN